jgi:hypothetical protein
MNQNKWFGSFVGIGLQLFKSGRGSQFLLERNPLLSGFIADLSGLEATYCRTRSQLIDWDVKE